MRRSTVSPFTVTFAVFVAFLLIEFQFNVLERGLGAYLDDQNAGRAKLAKFVDRETRNIEAQRKLETLFDQRAQQSDRREPEPPPVGPAEFVELEEGHKLVISRTRFTEAYQKLRQTPQALSQSDPFDETLHSDRWVRTILVRGGWFRQGRLFLVDDQNQVLHETSLSTEQFALLRVYGEATLSQIDRPQIRVYTPQTFFTVLRTLPDSIRDQIVSRDKLSYFEDHASRVGVSDASADGQVQVIVETIDDEQVDYVSITLAADAMQELLKALGVSDAETGAINFGLRIADCGLKIWN